jgi:hypothetical protein
MASPDGAEPPAARPYDAERARLRAAGLTDDEISRIFIARELGGSPQQAGAGISGGAPGHGIMSGVANNVIVALAHVRGAIPAVARQILTVGDRSASPAARLGAFVSLIVAAGLICVLGYAVFQEWQQHIISATEIAEQQAAKAKTETCLARMEFLKQNIYPDDFNADMTVKPGTRSAQMLAQYHKDCDPVSGGQQAGGGSTEALNKTAEVYQQMKKLGMDSLKSTNPNDTMPAINAACLLGVRLSSGLQMGDNRSDSAVGDSYPVCMGAALIYMPLAAAGVDLGPAHDLTKSPDTKSRISSLGMDVGADIRQCTDKRQSYTDLLACSCMAGARLGLHSIPDTVSLSKSLPKKAEESCNNIAVKLAETDGPGAPTAYRQMMADLKNPKPKDYPGAFQWQKQRAQEVERDEIREKGHPGQGTANAQTVLGWDALFMREFAQSLAASERAIQLDPGNLVPQTNRAHALMFLERPMEAIAIYLGHRGDKLNGKTWEQVISEDFAQLRKAGLTHPLMTQIEAAFSPTQVSPKETDPPPRSQDYINGAGARAAWEDLVATLTGDARDGAVFWASVRSDKARQHTCNEGKGASSQAFKSACDAAKIFFVNVDKNRLANADYRSGWNSR